VEDEVQGKGKNETKKGNNSKEEERGINRSRRRRSNLVLQNVYKSRDIVTEIKIRRLEWLGHVIRMEDTRIPKMIFNTKPEGTLGDPSCDG
jgi:hypothetical protein